jgi:NADPH2:quinone reductase
MRAVVVKSFGSPDGAVMENIADPHPSAGEILVEVQAAGVNFADLLVIQKKYQDLPSLPYVPGKEVSGTVMAVGEGIARIRPGDRVMAFVEHGAFAEQAIAVEADCFVIPDAMPFVEAASMGVVYQTAHLALEAHGRLGAGESVLITGASGGVGLAAIQLAKAKGATVLAGLTSPAKSPIVLENGADHVIDLTEENIRDALRAQVHEVTDGRGADVVIEIIGGEVFDASLRALAWHGRIVVIGFTSGAISTIKSNYLLLKNITASGLFFNSYRKKAPEWVARVQKTIFALYEAGKIRPPIMKTLSLADFAQAFSLITERKVEGRLVLTVR